jgi:hypothetical protein
MAREFLPPTQEAIDAVLNASKSTSIHDKYDAPTQEAIDAVLNQNKELPSKLESGVRGLAQGATFNFAPEITGALETAGSTVFGEDKLSDILSNYQKYRNQSEAAYKNAEETNPTASMVGNLVGGLAPLALSGGSSGLVTGAKGISTLGKIGRGAAIGAGYGGLSAAGASNADLIEAAKGDTSQLEQFGGDIVKGGAIGGALGGGLSAAGAGLSKAGKLIKSVDESSLFKALDDVAKNSKDLSPENLSESAAKIQNFENKEVLDFFKNQLEPLKSSWIQKIDNNPSVTKVDDVIKPLAEKIKAIGELGSSDKADELLKEFKHLPGIKSEMPKQIEKYIPLTEEQLSDPKFEKFLSSKEKLENIAKLNNYAEKAYDTPKYFVEDILDKNDNVIGHQLKMRDFSPVYKKNPSYLKLEQKAKFLNDQNLQKGLPEEYFLEPIVDADKNLSGHILEKRSLDENGLPKIKKVSEALYEPGVSGKGAVQEVIKDAGDPVRYKPREDIKSLSNISSNNMPFKELNSRELYTLEDTLDKKIQMAIKDKAYGAFIEPLKEAKSLISKKLIELSGIGPEREAFAKMYPIQKILNKPSSLSSLMNRASRSGVTGEVAGQKLMSLKEAIKDFNPDLVNYIEKKQDRFDALSTIRDAISKRSLGSPSAQVLSSLGVTPSQLLLRGSMGIRKNILNKGVLLPESSLINKTQKSLGSSNSSPSIPKNIINILKNTPSSNARRLGGSYVSEKSTYSLPISHRVAAEAQKTEDPELKQELDRIQQLDPEKQSVEYFKLQSNEKFRKLLNQLKEE